MEVPKSVKNQREDEEIMKIEILKDGSKLMKIRGREDRWRCPKEWRSISVSISHHQHPPNQLYPATSVESISRKEGYCRSTRIVGTMMRGVPGPPAGALSFVNSDGHHLKSLPALRPLLRIRCSLLQSEVVSILFSTRIIATKV